MGKGGAIAIPGEDDSPAKTLRDRVWAKRGDQQWRLMGQSGLTGWESLAKSRLWRIVPGIDALEGRHRRR